LLSPGGHGRLVAGLLRQRYKGPMDRLPPPPPPPPANPEPPDYRRRGAAKPITISDVAGLGASVGRVGCFLFLLVVALVTTLFIPPLGILMLFLLMLAGLFAR
jgi:hypothetical protein